MSEAGSNRVAIGFVGDTHFGENYWASRSTAGAVLQDRDYRHQVEPVLPFLRACDLAIANLETSLCTPGISPYEGRKPYLHWSDPLLVSRHLAASNVGAVSLGNNHAFDYGEDGLEQTITALDVHSIDWFGAGRNSREAGRFYMRDFRVGEETFSLAVLGGLERASDYKTLGYYATKESSGVHKLQRERVPRQIRDLKVAEPRRFVVAFPHWGQDYRWRNQKQIDYAQAFAEAGADLVIGHGTHFMGELERIDGTYVVQSLGNFVFNVRAGLPRHGAPPFSLPCRLIVAEASPAGLALSIRLYPLVTDGEGFDRPRFADDAEFNEARRLLLEHSAPDLAESVEMGGDEVGLYLSVALRTLRP